nr:ubiquinol-cytochrome C chaperone family protein [Aquabacter spiritensis]
MIFNLFRRPRQNATIERLYGAIVAQSRRPDFYTALSVPDTIEGRFELLLLHTFLICHRLKAEDEAGKAMSQDVFDAFLDDMDRTLREMGVGDLSVPKRMKKIGQAFYGRTAAYDAALAEGQAAVAAALARNVFEVPPGDPRADRLASYVGAAVRRLAQMPVASLAGESAPFPAPDQPEAPYV